MWRVCTLLVSKIDSLPLLILEKNMLIVSYDSSWQLDEDPQEWDFGWVILIRLGVSICQQGSSDICSLIRYLLQHICEWTIPMQIHPYTTLVHGTYYTYCTQCYIIHKIKTQKCNKTKNAFNFFLINNNFILSNKPRSS